MSVQKEKTINIPYPPDEAFDLARAALEQIGAKVERENRQQGLIRAKKGFSWRSYGESMLVEISAIEGQASIYVTSESAHTSTVLDWGKNQQNLDHFEAALKRLIGFRTPPEVTEQVRATSSPVPQTSDQRIFISYRRSDSADVTGRIYDRLISELGKDSIFKDVDNIPLGVNFKAHLDNTIHDCSAVLVIIGPQWVTAEDDQGGRRLDDPLDFVRIEVESALDRDIPVIPILVRGASMPDEEKLPESLRGLVYRNGILIRPDPDFHNDMSRLIKYL